MKDMRIPLRLHTVVFSFSTEIIFVIFSRLIENYAYIYQEIQDRKIRCRVILCPIVFS